MEVLGTEKLILIGESVAVTLGGSGRMSKILPWEDYLGDIHS